MGNSPATKPSRLDLTGLVGRSMEMQMDAAKAEMPLEHDLWLVEAIERDLKKLSLLSVVTEDVPREVRRKSYLAGFKPEKEIYTLLSTSGAMTLAGIERALRKIHPSHPRLTVMIKSCLKSLVNAHAIVRANGHYRLAPAAKKAFSKRRTLKRSVLKRIDSSKRAGKTEAAAPVSDLEEALARCADMVKMYQEVEETPEEVSTRQRGEKACMRMMAAKQKLHEMSNRLDGWNDAELDEPAAEPVFMETVTMTAGSKPMPTLIETVTMTQDMPVEKPKCVKMPEDSLLKLLEQKDRIDRAKSRMDQTKAKLATFKVPMQMLSKDLRASYAKTRMEYTKQSLSQAMLNPTMIHSVSNVA